MFVTMLDQAPALLTVRQRRLVVLVISAMLVLFLWLNEIPNPFNAYPFEPLHAAAMAALTLALIVLSLVDRIGGPALRIGGMAAATIGLMLLARTPSQTPIGAYIVILDATQMLRLRTALAITGVLCAVFIVTA